MKTGIELIAEERQRQIESEGYSMERDRQYPPEELVEAAIAYAIPEWLRWSVKGDTLECQWWPWPQESFKPSPDNRIRELTKAGALIAAEIDRLQGSGVGMVYNEDEDEWYLSNMREKVHKFLENNKKVINTYIHTINHHHTEEIKEYGLSEGAVWRLVKECFGLNK